jgi:hypothetical protein
VKNAIRRKELMLSLLMMIILGFAQDIPVNTPRAPRPSRQPVERVQHEEKSVPTMHGACNRG